MAGTPVSERPSASLVESPEQVFPAPAAVNAAVAPERVAEPPVSPEPEPSIAEVEQPESAEPTTIEVLQPETKEPVAETAPVAEEVAQPAARSPRMSATETAAPPPAPFLMNLRGQASGSDARAERLIRQIRGEVETLRQTLDEMATAQDDMVAVDLEAVLADPAAAAGLPPAILVRGLVSSAKKIASLNEEMASVSESVTRLQALNHELQIEHSYNRGRLEALDEVVAALHGNLHDLRLERDQMLLLVNTRANGNGNGNGAHGQLPSASSVIESHASD